QRANRSGLKGIFGVSFSHVSQARLEGERSSGGGYSQAPVGLLRPSVNSTMFTSPMAPLWYISLAFATSAELTRCEPISTIRLFFSAASIMAKPSGTVCDIGFSQ